MKMAMNIDIYKNKLFILSDEEKLDIIRRLSGYIESRKEITFAYIYGSFIDEVPFHDIDVGVYISEIKKKSATPYALDLAHFLSNALRIRTDVYVLNYAPALFSFHVIKGRMIFERDENFRIKIVENTIREYMDIKPLIHRSIKEAFAT